MISRRQTLVIACYLLLLGVGGALLADTAWKSVTQYQSDYAIDADLPSGAALTSRLVLVVLDGIRVDAAADMPELQALAERGSSGVAITELPSLSNPGRATLSTGAGPEVHGVTNNSRFSPPPVDSIFSIAQEQGLPVAVYGSYFWGRAFGDYLSDERVFSFDKELGPSPDVDRLVEWQNEICAEMVPTLSGIESGLIVAGLTATDEAGHDFGGESDEYRAVVAAVDACLGLIVEALDTDETTFLVIADHGHIHRRGQGGHGGSEPEVVLTPLVLAGRGIARSSGWTARQLDVAPTISGLLGLPLPANSQGEVLWQALELTEAERVELAQRADEQRAVVRSTMPDREVLQADGRRSRMLVGLLWAVWFLAAILGSFWASPDRRAGLAAAVGFHLAGYFALYWAFGLGYSLSDVVREEYLNWFFLRNATAAAASLLLAKRLFRVDVLSLAVVVTSIFGCRVAWVWYDSGLLMGRLILDLDQAFMAYMDLLHNLAVAVTAVIVALVTSRATARVLTP